MLPLLLGSLGLGLYETIKGMNDLSDLHKQPEATYSETPEMRASRARAEGLAQGGYSPAERARFENLLSQGSNTAYTRAVQQSGGNLAKAVMGATNIQNQQAQQDFAGRDAQLHRQQIQYADTFAKNLQNISNMNIQQQQRTRLMAEQALGGAVSSGLSQIGGAVNFAALGGLPLGKKSQTPQYPDWIMQMIKGQTEPLGNRPPSSSAPEETTPDINSSAYYGF